jgi:NAD(P)-dependent dehydrogenase (short-subunit alcohol dehydrogenase family)
MRDRSRPLAGDVAVVTGGGRGIGRACARELAACGAAVAVVARTAREVEAVAKEIESAGGVARAFPCDVSDAAAVRALASAIGASGLGGPVSIIVNNAGSGDSAPFLKTSLEMWQKHMRVNVESALLVTQAFLGPMLERKRGRVIMIASIAGKRGYPYISAYSASKHAMIGLTRALAAEVAKSGVTVNAVCPGYVDTPMTDHSVGVMVEKTKKSEAEIRDYLAKTSPQERIFAPEEVAAIVAALASDGFAGVNGQSIHLDGGEIQS